MVLGILLLFSSFGFAAKPSGPPAGWSVSPYKILSIEHSRLSRGRLERWLFQGSIEQQKRILLTMARIQDPAFLEPINRLLNRSRNTELRQMAAFALGSIESESSFIFVSQNAPMHKDLTVVSELLVSAGRSGDPKAIPFLAHYLKPIFPAIIHEGACRGFGHVFTRLGEKVNVDSETLQAIAKLTPTNGVGFSAAFALARFNGDAKKIPVATIAEVLKNISDPSSRSLLYRMLGKTSSAIAADALTLAISKSPQRNEQVEALKALGTQQPTESVLSAIKTGLNNPARHVQIAALDAAGKLGRSAGSLSAEVETLLTGSGSDWVRSEAIRTLARMNADLARQHIYQNIYKTSGLTLAAMVYSLPILGTPVDMASAKQFLQSPHPKLVQRTLESLLEITQLPEDLGTAVGKTVASRDIAVVATAADVVEKHHLCNQTPALTQAFGNFSAADAVEARAAIVRAVASCRDNTQISFLEKALSDPQRVVTETAAKGLSQITGLTYAFPMNSSASAPFPRENSIDEQSRKTILFRTSRGDFSVRLYPDTPLTNYYFLKQAPSMKGRTFHRVVPNFVVQGGDPRGDGFGGAGYNIRDEISPRPHQRGTVGIATAGKDTGSCQFFVNLATNPHLVGRYTAFGEVTSGMDVLDKIEPTDTIIRVSVSQR